MKNQNSLLIDVITKMELLYRSNMQNNTKKKKKPGGTVIEFKRKQKSRIPHYSGSGITSITEYFSRILCLGPVFLPKPLL